MWLNVSILSETVKCQVMKDLGDTAQRIKSSDLLEER
jgi:hypothetical protein